MTAEIARTGTDQQRITAVLEALAREGVSVWFDLRGSTGVIEDRYTDYVQAAELAGTDRWVGEHVGNRDRGGAYWDEDGVLRTRPNGVAWARLLWSFNHEIPDLADLLVRLHCEQGFDADWSGDPFDCVSVPLDAGR
ncbi:hypothetical protein GCM10010172_07190 [Paractinoplanes ferrugineus]|uniref:Uncharacterized protein n=1 Tax=Paractinoplanes ferrugineus TaxID=113564 RepID=A0A919MQX9_9ACTN|nr:hypothetical protein [Actinoplanes ferrugineus]GIE16802.1 hypothetical protein Afe05nite_86420 [Actinoplanes ferrugineus]